MILLAGAFELLPLLAVLLLGAAWSLAVALGWGGALFLLGKPLPAALLLGAVLCVLVAIVELGLRRHASRALPEWVATLAELAASDVVRQEIVGGKAMTLARLEKLGAPVPDTLVLTTSLVDEIRTVAAGKAFDGDPWSSLPASARREIEAFLAGAKGNIVVRASFTDRTGAHSYAGVFPAVRDVDPKDRERVVAAVLELVASNDDAVAREYRKRRRVTVGPCHAVLLQRQLEAEITGCVLSHGPAGRADSVTVDFAKRRSPVRSYRYDLLDGVAVALGADEKFDAPAWMHRLSILAVVLEAEFGWPVQVEFALEEGQPYVVDVRRAEAASRKTWVHAAPLDVTGERLPRFAQELRGGIPLVRQGLSEMLARAGTPGAVSDDEVRYVDGLVYVDADVLRRALARLGRDLLLAGGASVTVRAMAAVRRRPIPSVPMVTEITPRAWQELRAFHRKYLLEAARTRFELVAREWLVRCLLRLTDGTGALADEQRGHPALRYILSRRVRQASEEAGRQRDLLEQAEAELGGAVARLLARGAEAWNAMFTGDRHLFATLEEIDAWHGDAPGREMLEGEWRSRRALFEARREEPIVARVHRPPIPEDPSPSPGRLLGMGVVSGVATAPAVLVSSQDRSLGSGAVLLLVDGRSDLCVHVYEAKGIVLLTGGLASPVATLAAELGVPTVLCPAARSLAGRQVTIDGALGSVAPRS